MNKVRLWVNWRKSFIYRNISLIDGFQIVIGDICIGEYNGIELYIHDIVKSNNKYYLIKGRKSDFSANIVFELHQVEIIINRDPTVQTGAYLLNSYAPIIIHSAVPDNFELIGNSYALQMLTL